MATDFITGMRADFWKNRKELAALDARKLALEEKRDRIQDDADALIAPLNVEIKGMIAERVGLQERQNFLALGLGRKVGEDPDAPKAAAA